MGFWGEKLVELEFGLGGFELGVGGFEFALAGPVFVDGEQVDVGVGDTITLGGVPLLFLPQTVADREEVEARRRAERPAADNLRQGGRKPCQLPV